MATLATLTPAQRLALRSLTNRLDRSFQRYADTSAAPVGAELTAHTATAQALVDALAAAGIIHTA
jgi:hypothetical protein